MATPVYLKLRIIVLSLLVCGLSGSMIPAQVSEGTLPQPFHNTWGTGHAYVPGSCFQWAVQLWYRGDNLKTGRLIRAMTMRGSQTYPTAAWSGNLEITLENTKLGFSGLSPKLANNLGARATVVFNKKINAPALPIPKGPGDDRNWWIVLDKPFVFLGPNFLIQLKSTGYACSGLNYHGQTLTPPATSTRHLAGEKSCGGTLAAAYNFGTYNLRATAVPPNSPVTFMFGFGDFQAQNILFPLDLTPLGMTACYCGFLPVFTAVTMANGAGMAGLALPLANLPLGTEWFFVQALHKSTANPVGAATTNSVTSILGSSGAWNMIFSLDCINALPGQPFTTNSGNIILYR